MSSISSVIEDFAKTYLDMKRDIIESNSEFEGREDELIITVVMGRTDEGVTFQTVAPMADEQEMYSLVAFGSGPCRKNLFLLLSETFTMTIPYHLVSDEDRKNLNSKEYLEMVSRTSEHKFHKYIVKGITVVGLKDGHPLAAYVPYGEMDGKYITGDPVNMFEQAKSAEEANLGDVFDKLGVMVQSASGFPRADNPERNKKLEIVAIRSLVECSVSKTSVFTDNPEEYKELFYSEECEKLVKEIFTQYEGTFSRDGDTPIEEKVRFLSS